MKLEELFSDPLAEAFDNSSYYKSFNGRIKKMYERAVVRTRTKGYDGIIDPQEFFDFAAKSTEYKKLFKEWEKNNFDIRFTPTLDRMNVKKGYVRDNLQFLSYSENVAKGNIEYNKKPYEARKIKVKATKDGESREFNSMTKLARFLKTSSSTVTRAIQRGTVINGWKISIA